MDPFPKTNSVVDDEEPSVKINTVDMKHDVSRKNFSTQLKKLFLRCGRGGVLLKNPLKCQSIFHIIEIHFLCIFIDFYARGIKKINKFSVGYHG